MSDTTSENIINDPRAANAPHPNPAQFFTFTLICSVIPALAAGVAATLGLQPWVMFTGLRAWFARPASARGACTP